VVCSLQKRKVGCLGLCVCSPPFVSDEYVQAEYWLAQQVPLGAVRRREDVEGKWSINCLLKVTWSPVLICTLISTFIPMGRVRCVWYMWCSEKGEIDEKLGGGRVVDLDLVEQVCQVVGGCIYFYRLFRLFLGLFLHILFLCLLLPFFLLLLLVSRE
jgi:hypothetical protein